MKKIKKNAPRIFFDILLFSLAVFAPWWISIFFAIVGSIIFKNYFEIFFVGLWLDAVPMDNILPIPFFISIFTILIFFCYKKIRTYIKTY